MKVHIKCPRKKLGTKQMGFQFPLSHNCFSFILRLSDIHFRLKSLFTNSIPSVTIKVMGMLIKLIVAIVSNTYVSKFIGLEVQKACLESKKKEKKKRRKKTHMKIFMYLDSTQFETESLFSRLSLKQIQTFLLSSLPEQLGLQVCTI